MLRSAMHPQRSRLITDVTHDFRLENGSYRGAGRVADHDQGRPPVPESSGRLDQRVSSATVTRRSRTTGSIYSKNMMKRPLSVSAAAGYPPSAMRSVARIPVAASAKDMRCIRTTAGTLMRST
jgi:hypothetical protein